MTTAARVHTWRGEAAVTLAAGPYTATFLPECGMLGVSLTHDGDELLALPRSIADYRRGMPRGGFTGLPLNAPYANRLSRRSFEIEGRPARIGRRFGADANGHPIHGTLEARCFAVELVEAAPARARLVATFAHHDPDLLAVFPFEHALTVDVALSGRGLAVTTIVRTDERVPVPVSFGWHPFLRVPSAPRHRWELGLPARRHVLLDAELLPTGCTRRLAAEQRALGRRTFDDHYALTRDRRCTLSGAGRRIDVRFDAGYPHLQLYVPPHDPDDADRTAFACIEPMTAPIDALVAGDTPHATRGNPYAATFTIAANRT